MKNIIVLLIIACIITSCQFMPVKKSQINVPDIHTGRLGVTLAFAENTPPAEVYEESPFEIILNVYNQGANNIRGGTIILSVEEQNIELLSQRDARFDLSGKSVFNPEGTFEMKEFRAMTRKLSPAAGKTLPTTVTATACYPYKTSATSLVCIDTDLRGLIKNKPCKVSTLSYGSGQGAPVSVVSVVPKMLPHTDPEKIIPEFTITVSNPGGGDVVESRKIYEACAGKSVGSENWNRVNINAMLSDQTLQCTPSSVVLRTSENKAVCTMPAGIDKSMGVYSAPLSIELDYGYITKIVKSLTIARILSGRY